MQTPAVAPSRATRRGLVGLEQRLLRRWRSLGCPRGTTVVVGFSGGADSLALAAALGQIAAAGGARPFLVHVDHRLRDGSASEQHAAGALAAALALPFRGVRLRGDVRLIHPGVGVEEAARRERYAALAGVAAEFGGAPLALAHHEEDQAETVLLHLLRGAGLAGAVGMAERSALTVPWWDGGTQEHGVRLDLWRPFLPEPRSVVRAYAAGLGLAPVDDPSNRDAAPRRNALRQEALPLLEAIAPGAAAALARFGRLAADDDAVLERVAATALARAATPDGGLRAVALGQEPRAVARRVVRRWLNDRARGSVPTADRVDAVLALAARGEGQRYVEIGEGWSVRLVGGVLRGERTVRVDGPLTEGDERC